MYSKNLFGNFYPINSLIHRLNPTAKMVNFFLFIMFILATNDLKTNILMALLILFMLYLSKVPKRFYFNMFYALRYLYLALIIICASFGMSLELTLVLILKIIMLIMYLSIITFTTSYSEQSYGIEKFLTPFNLFNFKVSKVAMFITNIIRLIPLMVTTGYKILRSQSSRGIDYNNSDIFGRLYAISNIIFNTLSLTIRKMKQIKKVSELRMFSVNRFRTNLRLNKYGFKDTIFIGLHLIVIFASVLSRGLL